MNQNDFDQKERQRDLERETSYYSEDRLCLRCEEDEAELDEDHCSYCLETIRLQNKDRFIAQETY